MTALRDLAALAVCVLICFAAAGIGSLWTSASVGTWYQQIERPSWTPPDSLFGPVWTALYLMMAFALWLVWRERGVRGAPGAMAAFAAQLVLNTAWSGIFFGLRMPALAFAELLLLWLAIAVTIVLFWRVRPLAAALLVPYIAWVSFAGALNFAIWRLNV